MLEKLSSSFPLSAEACVSALAAVIAQLPLSSTVVDNIAAARRGSSNPSAMSVRGGRGGGGGGGGGGDRSEEEKWYTDVDSAHEVELEWLQTYLDKVWDVNYRFTKGTVLRK